MGEISSLNEFVEENYTFVYIDSHAIDKLFAPIHIYMEPEFVLRKLNPNTFNASSLGVKQRHEAFGQITKKNPKHCMLGKDLKQFQRFLQDFVLQGQHKCFVAYERISMDDIKFGG